MDKGALSTHGVKFRHRFTLIARALPSSQSSSPWQSPSVALVVVVPLLFVVVVVDASYDVIGGGGGVGV